MNRNPQKKDFTPSVPTKKAMTYYGDINDTASLHEIANARDMTISEAMREAVLQWNKKYVHLLHEPK